MDFSGKIAVVTGGGGGIGRATSLGFAQHGAKVVVVDQDASLGEGTVGVVRQSGGEAAFVHADVTKSADVRGYVQAALDRYGRIDLFFNNAGIEGTIAPTAEYDEEMFDRVMAVNVRGVFLGLRHVLPVMLKQGGGAIVNTASVAGLTASPGMPAYVASKHAVIGLTKAAAGEVAAQRHPRQCRLPRPDRHAHDPLARRAALAGKHRSVRENLCRDDPARRIRQARGDRRTRAVPVLGRRGEHDRWSLRF